MTAANAPTPLNDPLWAYDTPGWTNQGNTGDIPTAGAAGLNASSALQEPEFLSGYISRSLDPIAISNGAGGAGQALANTIAYFTALQILDPVITAKVVVLLKETTSGQVTNLGLYNFAGTRLTTTTVTPSTTSFAAYTGTWGASQVLAPGTYYVGMSAAAANNTVAAVALTVEQTPLAQATTFAANVLNWRFFQSTVVAGALPATISGTIAGSTVGWFAGLL